MKICKNCGEIKQLNDEYCSNCGKNAFEISPEVVCPNCGKSNDVTFAHCIYCGSILQEQMALQAQSVKSEVEAIYATQVAEISLKETAVCPNCGQEVAVNSVYCVSCGAPTHQMHDHRVVKRKICSHCEQPNLSTSTL